MEFQQKRWRKRKYAFGAKKSKNFAMPIIFSTFARKLIKTISKIVENTLFLQMFSKCFRMKNQTRPQLIDY